MSCVPVPCAVLLTGWRRLFPWETFNPVQSACFDVAHGSNRSLVVCAPTGSGKTGVLELAMARLWSPHAASPSSRRLAVYMAPLKAVTHERLLDWKPKFSALGLNVVELTGDSVDDGAEESVVQDADLILTTPEKWDSFSRFRRDAQGAIGRVELLLIDEVHLLTDPARGPTLEAVVSRMRTIASSVVVRSFPIASLRIICASATVQNVEDLATWLGPDCAVRRFGEAFRPVRLSWKVLGFPMGRTHSFDGTLVGKLYGLVAKHSGGRPTLVFCNSRKVCGQAAQAIVHAAGPGGLVRADAARRDRLGAAAAKLEDQALASLVRLGVGFHTAALKQVDKQAVHSLFAEGILPVVVATAGLAQGVNLPARLVIIMNTAKCGIAALGTALSPRISCGYTPRHRGPQPRTDPCTTPQVCLIGHWVRGVQPGRGHADGGPRWPV